MLMLEEMKVEINKWRKLYISILFLKLAIIIYKVSAISEKQIDI